MKGGYLGDLLPCWHVQALLSPGVRAVPGDLLELVWGRVLWSSCPWREVEVPAARAPKGLQKAWLQVAAQVGALGCVQQLLCRVWFSLGLFLHCPDPVL